MAVEDYDAALGWIKKGEAAGFREDQLTYLKAVVLARQKSCPAAQRELDRIKDPSPDLSLRIDYLRAQIHVATSTSPHRLFRKSSFRPPSRISPSRPANFAASMNNWPAHTAHGRGISVLATSTIQTPLQPRNSRFRDCRMKRTTLSMPGFVSILIRA